MIRPCALVALLALAVPALADVIPEGVVSVSHEVRLEQARDFGVTFVVFPTDASAPWQQEKHEVGVAVVGSGAVMPPFGRWESPHLWAVTGALPAELNTVSREWMKAHAVECPTTFERIRYLPEEEGVASVLTVYRVVDASPQGVRVEGISETRLGKDGAVKSRGLPGAKADRRSGSLLPDPARSPIVGLGVAGLALGLLLVRRGRRPASGAALGLLLLLAGAGQARADVAPDGFLEGGASGWIVVGVGVAAVALGLLVWRARRRVA